jgi:hypothetical protein
MDVFMCWGLTNKGDFALVCGGWRQGWLGETRSMRLWIAVVGALSILAPGVGQAGVPATCLVDLHSDQGGRVQLGKISHEETRPAGTSSWVSWTPPASAKTTEMSIGYLWSVKAPIGDVIGGGVMFTPATPAVADDYTVRLTTGAGAVWTYEPADLDERPGEDDVTIDPQDVRGSAILAAVGRGERVTVEIIRDGTVETTNTFDFSKTQARDALVVQAIGLVEHNDPSVCKPD